MASTSNHSTRQLVFWFFASVVVLIMKPELEAEAVSVGDISKEKFSQLAKDASTMCVQERAMEACNACTSVVPGMTPEECCANSSVFDLCLILFDDDLVFVDAEKRPSKGGASKYFLGKRQKFFLGKRPRNTFLGKRSPTDKYPNALVESLENKQHFQGSDEKRIQPFLGMEKRQRGRNFLGKRQAEIEDKHKTGEMVEKLSEMLQDMQAASAEKHFQKDRAAAAALFPENKVHYII